MTAAPHLDWVPVRSSGRGPLFVLPDGASELTAALATVGEHALPMGVPHAVARRLFPGLSPPVGASLVAALVAAVPPVVAPLIGCRGIELLWLSLWAVLQVLMTVFALLIWERALRVADPVDEMIEPGDRPRLYGWLAGRADRRPQAIVLGIGLVAGGLACIPIAHALRGRHLCAMSYLQIVMLAGLGCSIVYWNSITTMFVWRLARLERLHVRWAAPARTPGIRAFSRFCGLQTRFASAGALVFSIPVGWAYVTAGHNTLLLSAIVAALVLTAGAIFSVYWVPQRLLSQIVRREKDRVLDRLRASVGTELPSPHSDDDWETVEGRFATLAVVLAIEDTEDSVHDFVHSLRALIEVGIAVLGYAVSLVLAHAN